MIYLVSKKYFKKHIAELVSSNDYFLIDGENYGVTGKNSGVTSQSYGNCHNLGGFSPETELFTLLKRITRDYKVNQDKVEKLKKQFYKSKDFRAASLAAIKAQCTFDYDINVVIILPQIIMKTLGKEMVKKIQNMVDVKFKFIYSSKEMPKKRKELETFMDKSLKKKQMKKLYKEVKKLEKKVKIKIDEEDDDNWRRR